MRNAIPASFENNRLAEDNNILEETDRFGTDLLPVDYEDEEGIEENGSETENVHNDYNENVGFGSADVYNTVEELIELSKMNLEES